MLRMVRTLMLACLSLAAYHSATAADVVSWPAPDGEALCEDYELRVNGQLVPVYSCRVSAMPFNQVWPGYQRFVDQTELAGFASWDMLGPVKVEVQSRQVVRSVVVRPASRGIQPAIDNGRISFSLDRPGPVVVEVNGIHHALHLFPSPPEQDAPPPDVPGVRYFGPGVHRPGKIELQSNESIYIAGGAVVYGTVHARGASNLRIAGRGILDQSPFPRGAGGAVRLSGCSQVRIEGIVMRDPDVWCCSLFGCRDVMITDVKLVGLWRYNADGIDVCNSQDVEVRNNYSKDDRRGTVRDVVFKDIDVTGPHVPPSSFRGFDAEYGVEGVKIDNLRFNGKRAGNAQDAHLQIGPHVGHVQFSNSAPSQGNR